MHGWIVGGGRSGGGERVKGGHPPLVATIRANSTVTAGVTTADPAQACHTSERSPPPALLGTHDRLLIPPRRPSTEQAAERLVAQLRRVYGDSELECLEAIKVDWGTDEWSRGAYSSPTLGGHELYRLLRDTGAPNLVLAGEAVHPRGSTVCSALESGRWAAETLVERFGGERGDL